MADSIVPTVKSLAEIYPPESLSSEKARWKKLFDNFKVRYGRPPEFVVRSPGRVNIIGEHIDYSLFEVLPMAITADIIIAVSTTESKDPQVDITNVNAASFPNRQFDIPQAGDVEIDASKHEWTNYFKAGLRGGLKNLRETNSGNTFMPRAMQVLVDGTVPSGAGLSSSAAFVCASVVASIRANTTADIPNYRLVETAIESERAVGVNSGGQAPPPPN
ncbi:MAG: galactokinase [Trizodia sp. TS-e1964]|nr:MAG: galactokinase [Trizodia sp. TS-e1964]